MSIVILSSGLQTSLQDGGRIGHRHIGIPASGAADPLSLALANYCVGNTPAAAGLECTLMGPDIKFQRDTAFALCGAQAELQLNGRPAAMHMGHCVKAGDIVSVGTLSQGARAYLTIAGGLKGQSFLGSISTYSYAKLGGVNGGFLNDGDTLESQTSELSVKTLPHGFAPRYAKSVILRVMPGPEFSHLTSASQSNLCRKAFTASAQTDRMGSQLSGPKINLKSKGQLISSPLRIGTVQVPPSGLPILMLADGHCTGGYARALQVIRADRHLLGQIAPGMRVHFVMTEAKQAEQALAARQALYGWLFKDIR